MQICSKKFIEIIFSIILLLHLRLTSDEEDALVAFLKTLSDGYDADAYQEPEEVLAQNTPNPFNPTTQISFNLPEQGLVTLKVYNLVGQEVAVLVNGFESAGIKNVSFNANNLASGIYYYRLQTADFAETKKMILMK